MLPMVRRGGRDQSERLVAINRNAWSRSIGIGGRNHSMRARGKILSRGTLANAGLSMRIQGRSSGRGRHDMPKQCEPINDTRTFALVSPGVAADALSRTV